MIKKYLSTAPAGDHPLTALWLLLVGITLLALQDSLIKLLSDSTSFWQIQTLRSIGNIMITLCLACLGGGISAIAPKNKAAVLLRSTFMVICMFCFFSGSPFLSITQMAAGLYTYPLFVSMLAAPILGEKVSGWRITALILGFVGTFFMLNPFAHDFSFVQLLPVAAGFFYACNIIILRLYCKDETPLALTFANGLAFTFSGLLGVFFLSLFPLSNEIQQSMPFVAIGWPSIGISIILFAAGCSILNLFGNLGLIRAYQTAESSWLAPLDFSYLLFAAIWGKIIFNTWPTTYGLIGMILICTAGVITACQENNVRP